MNNDKVTDVESGPSWGWRAYFRGISRILTIVMILGGILFASAGSMDWPAAWTLVGLYAIYLLWVMLWGIRKAPDLLMERGRLSANVRVWDKVINGVYTVLVVAQLVVAGLDAQRLEWTSVPLAIQCLGGLGLIVSGWLIWRTMTENAYLSRWARIQDDRGQQVITSGPYAYVRHPMYSAIILLFLSMAFELGSYWAIVPGLLIGVLFIIRTVLEDRMLRQELVGYKAYAARVRYRLLPGIW
jgi:protein-S-isoprenylcysteine O-methyltransferase Ste14